MSSLYFIILIQPHFCNMASYPSQWCLLHLLSSFFGFYSISDYRLKPSLLPHFLYGPLLPQLMHDFLLFYFKIQQFIHLLLSFPFPFSLFVIALTDCWSLALMVLTLSGSQMTMSASDPTAIRPLRGYILKILAALVDVTATNWFSSIFPMA